MIGRYGQLGVLKSGHQSEVSEWEVQGGPVNVPESHGRDIPAGEYSEEHSLHYAVLNISEKFILSED